MEPRISLVTLGVADLPTSVAFYETVLGWSPAFRSTDIAFFDLSGVAFALYPHEELAKDMGLSAGPPVDTSYGGFGLAHNLRSREEVDAVFSHLRNNNATIVKEPKETVWGGYSGYFADPDAHKWEVAFNPHWTIRDDGRIEMPAGAMTEAEDARRAAR